MSSSPTDTALIDVLLPQMGTSIAEGTIIAWVKEVGDEVEADETICEISTDKVDSECPAPVSGRLVEILVPVGETVDVGTVIGRIAAAGGVPGAEAPVAARELAGNDTTPVRATTGGDDGSRRGRRRLSPVVRRIADAHGIDPAAVRGTGRDSRITKRDILAHVERDGQTPEPMLHSESPYRPHPEPPATATDERASAVAALGGTPEPLPRTRQAIGAAMRRSQETSATAHTVFECDMTGVEQRRRQLGITALPIVARAAVETLGEFPDLNATLDGTTLTRFTRVHLGVAVSLGADGLIVPVIRDAQDLSEEGLANRIRDLARRARAQHLAPDDVQGATFTITSPGAAGGLIATPILPIPQVGILDLEAIVRRPVIVDDGRGGESIAIRSIAHLVLGWDHRAIDGMTAASFLGAVCARVEALE